MQNYMQSSIEEYALDIVVLIALVILLLTGYHLLTLDSKCKEMDYKPSYCERYLIK